MQGDASDLLYKERGEIFASIDENKGVNVEDLRALLVNICNLAIKTHSPLYVDIAPQNIWKTVEKHFQGIDPQQIVATKYHVQMILNLFANKIESVHGIPNLTNLHRRILGEEAVLQLIQNLQELG